MRRSKYNKDLYMDLMALLFRLLAKSRQQGMLSLEFDIDNPQESEISLIIRASLPITPWWSSLPTIYG